MGKQRTVLVLSESEKIYRSIRSVAQPRVDVVNVREMSSVVLPLTKGQVSAVIVDLASRMISADDLMAIARVAEGRDVPLLILTRQQRQAVKALASVLNARDVISTTDSDSMIGARIRLWLGIDADLEQPHGFAIVAA